MSYQEYGYYNEEKIYRFELDKKSGSNCVQGKVVTYVQGENALFPLTQNIKERRIVDRTTIEEDL